ncbi:hypothetical protein JHK85_021495 [Glycine max]|nr:hypothetical protein JHK85_021495 [Glycine max]
MDDTELDVAFGFSSEFSYDDDEDFFTELTRRSSHTSLNETRKKQQLLTVPICNNDKVEKRNSNNRPKTGPHLNLPAERRDQASTILSYEKAKEGFLDRQSNEATKSFHPLSAPNSSSLSIAQTQLCSEKEHPKVLSVFENRGRKLHTTRSWDFMELEHNGVIQSSSIWKKARFGEGVIIGNLDTGGAKNGAKVGIVQGSDDKVTNKKIEMCIHQHHFQNAPQTVGVKSGWGQ